MQRRRFSREYKLEAVKQVLGGKRPRQVAEDLDLHENVLRKWVKDYRSDRQHAFPGHGQMKPDAAEVEQLKREIARLKAERDILKKAAAFFAKEST